MKFQAKIDFQAHYLPKAYYAFLAEEGLYCPDGFPTSPWRSKASARRHEPAL